MGSAIQRSIGVSLVVDALDANLYTSRMSFWFQLCLSHTGVVVASLVPLRDSDATKR